MLQYLVRHGESLFNVEDRVQGQVDVGLSLHGRRQTLALAEWARRLAADTPVAEVWSSPLVRARDTAAAIAAPLGLPVREDDDLRELHAGVFQGHLWDDLERLHPEAVRLWRGGDPEYRIPGGESRADLAARGRRVLERLAARGVARMVVVAHGGVLTAALGSLVGATDPLLAAAARRPFTRLPALSNASVSQLEWPGPRLRRFNATDHLGT